MFNIPQWINWRLEQRPGEPKPAKVPFDVSTGHRIDPHNPAVWMPYELARAIDPAHVGFVLTKEAGIWCIDLDHAWNGTEWSPLALDIVSRFPGAYIEVSHSGDGLHIIGRGTPPPGFGTRGPGVEFYTHSRFIAITGAHAQGDPESDHTAALSAFCQTYLKPASGPFAPLTTWTTGPSPDAEPIADDNELIEKMVASKPSAHAAFGGGATPADLWFANEVALAVSFPPTNATDPYGRSEADAALAMHLAFWTGKDCDRMLRLMRRSKLARDKWERDDYLPRTIISACSNTSRVYSGRSHFQCRKAQIAENIRIGDELPQSPTPTIFSVDEMIERLVFVGTSGAVVDRISYRTRKKDAAHDEYAASILRYKDPDTGKEKQIPALKAWIGSRDRVTVDTLTWYPGAPQICTPPEPTNGSETAFNTWRGFAPTNAPDDWQIRVSAFLEHVAYLVPIEAEHVRFICWLAHILQRPDQLPHTAYLMIAEQTGIGRNLLASILVRVLPGCVAAGVALDGILDGKFNGRISQKLLAIVDEVREGMGERRYQRGEHLKSLITEEYRRINEKYGLEWTEKNCCRWLMFSNHRDALPFENNDRRIVVIENPTERRSPDYYARLYGLVDDPLFIASVRHYLTLVDLSGFNPGAHAPMNEAKAKSLDAMTSETERAVIEFKSSCGFELTTRDRIRDYITANYGHAAINDIHLTKAIARAGMVSTGRRVKIGMKPQSVV